jgi:hypothetical protein
MGGLHDCPYDLTTCQASLPAHIQVSSDPPIQSHVPRVINMVILILTQFKIEQ